ncbi:MAG: DUF1934 domain-containing protein [bacterium]|nr:DUF1934 domain-containing protein [bacterium]
MTKDVLIRIKGSHLMNEDQEMLELMVLGQYYFRNGKHFLVYDEVMEEGGKPVHNVVKITENLVEISKNGQVESKMRFEKDKKEMSRYVTPFGEIWMGLDTKKIQMQQEADSLQLEVQYALELNYEHTSDCTLCMEVSSVEGA